MQESKYKFDPELLSYKKIEHSRLQKFIRTLLPQFLTGIVIAFLLFIAAAYFFDSPEERALSRENDLLSKNIDKQKDQFDNTAKVLENIMQRDSNIYRAIFESDPLKREYSKSFFGENKYLEKLDAMDSKFLAEQTDKKIIQLDSILDQQSDFIVKIKDLIRQDPTKIKQIPSIQPIDNKDLKRIPYGYGKRIDPVYKSVTFHHGMDFSAPIGTDVRATADGVIERVVGASRIMGMYVIINHGNGYKSIYAHLSSTQVFAGKKVTKGEKIAEVGDSGKTICSQLHYEVHRNNKSVNPIHFFFADVTPEQYDKMLELASMSGQSLD